MKSVPLTLGLRANWSQFLLLVLVNALVGGLLGLERTLLPLMAANQFEQQAFQQLLSFIVVFGVAKAISNYLSGPLANRFSRKKVLVSGWVLGLPVPLLLGWMNHWHGILIANVFLGMMQGLTWSSTVVMKIDLVGERQRGLAMGMNESAGYLSVAAMAWLTARWVGPEMDIQLLARLGMMIVGLGLGISLFFVRDTDKHVQQESAFDPTPFLKQPFLDTSFRIPSLRAITQAGFVNNLNDGMMWGLMPLFLMTKGFDLQQVGFIVALYPAVWGLGQMVTGRLADIWCKKTLLWVGMLIQGLVILLMTSAEQMQTFVLLSILLGIGTALVYPTFLSSIAAHTHPRDRASALGAFRFWRDLGYSVGALVTGWLADRWDIPIAMGLVGWLTIASGLMLYRDLQCRSTKTSRPTNTGACLSSQA